MSMVVNMVLSEPLTMKKIFFNIDNVPWVSAVTNVFYLNPCFQLGKIFGDIASVVSPAFDPMSLAWADNSRDFEYKDLYREQRGTFFSKDRYVVVSMYETLWSLIYVSSGYIICAWYFDQTLQANRGVPLPWYFPMDPAYWFSFMGLGGFNSQVADISPLKVVKS